MTQTTLKDFLYRSERLLVYILCTLQASTSGAPAPLTTSFNLVVTANPDFVLSQPADFPEVNAGSAGTSGTISVVSRDGFNGTVMLSCPATYGSGSCSISPVTVNRFPATATLTINGSSFTGSSYTLSVTGTSGSIAHTLPVPFNVGDYAISGSQTVSVTPAQRASAELLLTSSYFYAGKINATCDASALPGGMCRLSPANPLTLSSGGTTSSPATINVPNDANASHCDIKVKLQDTTGAPSHSANITLTVAQGFLVTSSTSSQTVTAGQTSGPYALRVQPVGSSFDGIVTLASPRGFQRVLSASSIRQRR